MKLAPLLLCSLLLLTACPSEQWIQVGNSRAAVVPRSVQFLDAPPTRPHEVVGIITPPAGEYETEAEAVKGMRKQAAKRRCRRDLYRIAERNRRLEIRLWLGRHVRRIIQ